MENIRKIKNELKKKSGFDSYQLSKFDGIVQSVINLLSKVGLNDDFSEEQDEEQQYKDAIEYICNKLQERIQSGTIFR